MSFLWPYMLWLLFLIPVAVAVYILLLRKKRKAAVRFGSLSIVKQAMVTGPGFRRHIPPMLFLLAFAVMIFALARPVMEVTLPSQRGTIILAIDVSGSMRADDVEPNRLVAAQTAAREFVDAQPDNVRIGVVAFAGGASVIQQPTDSKTDVLAALEILNLQRGTAVGSGLLSSLITILDALGEPLDVEDPTVYNTAGLMEYLASPAVEQVSVGEFRPAMVVLLTDGQTTEGPDPIEVAQIAKSLGVRVFTVGLGTPEGVVLGFRGRSFRVVLDAESLNRIAEITGGDYSEAATEEALNQVYRNLGTSLTFETEETELTALATALGAAFMSVGAILSMLWFGKIV